MRRTLEPDSTEVIARQLFFLCVCVVLRRKAKRQMRGNEEKGNTYSRRKQLLLHASQVPKNAFDEEERVAVSGNG
jgi:hypothetical protein